MPDKQNENKFMAMLERKGIVRKAGAEEGLADTEPVAARPRAEVDLRSLFGSPDGEDVNVTPAARQPVPGLSNPVFPGDKNQQEDFKAHLMPAERTGTAHTDIPEEPLEQEYAASAESAASIGDATIEQPNPTDPSAPGGSQITVEAPLPMRDYGNIMSIDPFKDEYISRTEPTATQVQQDQQAQQVQQAWQNQQVQPAAPVYAPEKPSIDSYTDRYLDIEELYEVLSLKSKRTDTVYLIEEYLKTLPDSLPDQSRRDIVGKIVAASGFDYDLLTGDGVLRVKMLKEYAERFALYTEEYIAARNTELDGLEQQIMTIRRLIENRRDLHKKQFFAIEAEAQRLKEILTFISG